MELLRELMRLQHDHGWLDNVRLAGLAKQRGVPLYRLEELVSFYPHFRRTPPPRTTVRFCRDAVCRMGGCQQRMAEANRRLAGRADVKIESVSCLGRCDAAPAVSVNDLPGRIESVDELMRWIGGDRDVCAPAARRAWRMDPYDALEDHYQAVQQLVAESGGDPGVRCIEWLTAAGLRGMGGAGFPTGRKWELVRGEPSVPKYVICNADESEPGTFKDRVILDELPHLVIEGMLLAGLTVGAEQGIVYLRHEYAPEQQSLETAIVDARRRGILGSDAAGSGRKFDLEVFVSPGGYILGEETALLEALEDRRGEPRNKPPYPGSCGLRDQPTLINNVETFAAATCIAARGVDWWRQQGVRGSAGLKFVSVSGDVRSPGVYEIPLGTTVRELIALAGGLTDGSQLQAFLPGGASSHFLPADKADTLLDFEAMKAAGSMLGTGAVIVVGHRHSLFDLAANLVRFFRNESCGKCVPCRMGTEKADRLLQEIRRGQRPTSELAILPELARTMEQTSLCGLGQVALNPIVSLLNHLPHVPIASAPNDVERSCNPSDDRRP